MSTIMAIITVIWMMINAFLLCLFIYVRYLLSKKHMTIFDKRCERIWLKFAKKRG